MQRSLCGAITDSNREYGKLSSNQLENWLSDVIISVLGGLQYWIIAEADTPCLSWHPQRLSALRAEWLQSYKTHICPPERLDNGLDLLSKHQSRDSSSGLLVTSVYA